mmetsp:Transcript_6479/g.9590  ORF Transcript_6479/g.9590 Transcript_6479/m.9590 type:complete len:83 (-) Transcript_6479:1244-1492(-)
MPLPAVELQNDTFHLLKKNTQIISRKKNLLMLIVKTVLIFYPPTEENLDYLEMYRKGIILALQMLQDIQKKKTKLDYHPVHS